MSTIEVFSEIAAEKKFSQIENVQLAVTFLIGIKKGSLSREELPLDITPQRIGSVIAERSKRLTVEEKRSYTQKKNVCFSHSVLCEWNPILAFEFRRTDRSRITYEVSVIGEYILDKTDGFQSLKLCWHPTALILKP